MITCSIKPRSVFDQVPAQAHATIADGDPNHACAIPINSHDDLTPGGRAIFHGLERVQEEIERDLDDIFQNLAELPQVGRAGPEKPLRGLGVAQDRRERLVELVRQRRRELPVVERRVTWASSARWRCIACSAARPSSMAVARNITGTDTATRKSCSESTLSGATPLANGPSPRTAPEIDSRGEDQEPRVGADRAESHGRPEQEGQGQIHQRGWHRPPPLANGRRGS